MSRQYHLKKNYTFTQALNYNSPYETKIKSKSNFASNVGKFDFSTFETPNNVEPSSSPKPLSYVDWHLYNVNSYFSRGHASAPSGSLGCYSPTEIRVRITSLTKNIDDNTETYRKIYGRPLQQFRQLKNLTGFTICDEFHLENFNTATESEKNEVTSLLKSGIIL